MRQKYLDAGEPQWEQEFDKHFADFFLFLHRYGKFPTQKDNPVLNRWLNGVIVRYKSKKLKQVYIDKLTAAGMQWNAKDVQWYEKYRETKKYLQEKKQLPGKDHFVLERWLTGQLILLGKNRISGSQKEMITGLNELVKSINPEEAVFDKETEQEKLWKQKFDELILYRQQQPDMWPKVNADDKEEAALAAWYRKQLALYNNQSLPDDHFARLNEIGVLIDHKKEYWNRRFEEVNSYLAAHNTLSGLPGNLRSWCKLQQKKVDRLPVREQQLIASLNLQAFGNQANWRTNFNKLANYVAQHNAMPGKSDIKLYQWLLGQKLRDRKNSLPDEQKSQLAALGIIFTPSRVLHDIWKRKFDELKQFREQNEGRWPRYASTGQEKILSNWCQGQRQVYAGTNSKSRYFSQQCIDELNAIGFRWSQGDHYHDDKWADTYRLLKEFVNENGKEHISRKLKQSDEVLYNWLWRQRKAIKKNQLPGDRLEKLRMIEVI